MSFPGMLSLIETKKSGGALDESMIRGWIHCLVKDEIPEYQTAALLMAIRLVGMTFEETLWLTQAMAESGERLQFTGYPSLVDKHSTGGVGDKVTLILAPMVAACGLPVTMLSGRALGFSGGTIDKFEALEGVSCLRSGPEMQAMIDEFGWANAQANSSIAPADRILYALRDVTGTVDSIPLITASILSKKLSGGATHLCLDVKSGSGAFMQDLESAKALAGNLQKIGEMGGIRVSGFVSRMEEPLGHTIGNYLELIESVSYLKKAPETHLMELCLALGSRMLQLGNLASTDEDARQRMIAVIEDGSALEKLVRYLRFNGATEPAIDNLMTVTYENYKRIPVLASRAGYVQRIDSRALGNLGVQLGAGRAQADDKIEPIAGFSLARHLGDHVEKGAPLAWIYGEKAETLGAPFCQQVEAAFTVGDASIASPELLLHEF